MKILLGHPHLGAGGSEAVVMALLELLQNDHEITLTTGSEFECDRLNRAYHTCVDPTRIQLDRAPMPRWLPLQFGGDALRGAYFVRHVRQIASRFDLCVSAYNFLPFGRPALHFVADFSWDESLRRETDPAPPGLRGLLHRFSPARRLYLATSRAIGGDRASSQVGTDDVVIANSEWTAAILSQRHGITSRVIYPPVHAEPFDLSAPRTNDFIMLGRISPDKRVEEAIATLARVRARGHVFNFHIIGPLDASAYSARIRTAAQAHGEWVHLPGGVYGKEKFAEVARHSFSLHMRTREAFGIAVAEQVKMGLIPFVPAQSAPTEIVGDPRLFFDDADHAVEIIDRVLRDADELADITQRLRARAELFSAERFRTETRALVADRPMNTTASWDCS